MKIQNPLALLAVVVILSPPIIRFKAGDISQARLAIFLIVPLTALATAFWAYNSTRIRSGLWRSVLGLLAILTLPITWYIGSDIYPVAFVALMLTALVAVGMAVSEQLRQVLAMALLGTVLTGFGIWATVAVWKGEITGIVFWGPVPIPLILFGLAALLGGVLALVGSIAGLVESIGDLIEFVPRLLKRTRFREWTVTGYDDPQKVAKLASTGDAEKLWRIFKKRGGSGSAWLALTELGDPTRQVMQRVLEERDSKLPGGRRTHDAARSMLRILDSISRQESDA